jgi:hypothetical protein
MKSAIRFILTLGISLVLVAGVRTRAQSHYMMSDPIFGISYDPQKVHFEPVASSIVEHCPELRDRYVGAWVYGRSTAGDTQYLIISGFLKDQDRGSGIKDVDFGLAVQVRGTKCAVTHWEYFLRGAAPTGEQPRIRADESLLKEIAADILRRYALAFGGKKEFLNHVTQEDMEAAPPVLRTQLKLFENK